MFNSFFKRKKSLSLKEQQFIDVMKWANKIVHQDSHHFPKKDEALHDLIKIIMKPIQAEHIRNAYLTHAHNAIKEIEFPQDFFGSYFLTHHIIDKYIMKNENLSNQYLLKLSSNIVLPTCWHPSSLVSNLGSIGHENRLNGEFEQNYNHYVVLVLPMMIGFVSGGNHSITQGILSGNGEIVPNLVVNLSSEQNEISFNGTHWINPISNQIIGTPRYIEFGWIWEISKLLSNKG